MIFIIDSMRSSGQWMSAKSRILLFLVGSSMILCRFRQGFCPKNLLPARKRVWGFIKLEASIMPIFMMDHTFQT